MGYLSFVDFGLHNNKHRGLMQTRKFLSQDSIVL